MSVPVISERKPSFAALRCFKMNQCRRSVVCDETPVLLRRSSRLVEEIN
jgi:hypothetical protein